MNSSSLDWIEAYSQVASANSRAFDKLVAVLDAFQAAGIDAILLKGADVLPRLYGAWGMRPMTDVDMLVRERDVPAIDRIVRRLGYLPEIDGNPAYRAPDNTLAIDLITEIWYADDLPEIWQRSVSRSLGDLRTRGLGSNDLVLFLTAYIVLYRGRFSPAYPKDLALLIKKEQLDWDFILERASHYHLKIPLYHGLSYAMLHQPISIPEDIVKKMAPSHAAERWLLFVLQKLVTDKYVSDVGHALLFITQPNGKRWRWLQSYFCPTPAFLTYRYGDQPGARPWWIRLKRAAHLTWQAQVLFWQVVYLLVRRA
jgi:hypothetical protein